MILCCDVLTIKVQKRTSSGALKGFEVGKGGNDIILFYYFKKMKDKIAVAQLWWERVLDNTENQTKNGNDMAPGQRGRLSFSTF